MTADRWIAVIAVIVAVVAIAVSAGLSIWAVKVSRQIAHDSGTDKAPLLRLGFASLVVETNKIFRVGFGVDAADHRPKVIPLPLRLANIGGRAIEDVTVEIVFPAVYDAESFNIKFVGSMPGADRKTMKVGKRDHVYYHFPSIHPGRAVGIDEPFLGESTNDLKLSVPLEEIGIQFNFSASILLAFDVIISSKELMPDTVRFEVGVASAMDFPTLAREFRRPVLDDERPQTGRFAERLFKGRPKAPLPPMILVLPAFSVSKTTAQFRGKEIGELLLPNIDDTKCVWYYPTAGFYVENNNPHWI
jgi:hypothetical protein